MKTTRWDSTLEFCQEVIRQAEQALEKAHNRYNPHARKAILELLGISYEDIIEVTAGGRTSQWRVLSEAEIEARDDDKDCISIRDLSPTPYTVGQRRLTLDGARMGSYDVYNIKKV